MKYKSLFHLNTNYHQNTAFLDCEFVNPILSEAEIVSCYCSTPQCHTCTVFEAVSPDLVL